MRSRFAVLAVVVAALIMVPLSQADNVFIAVQTAGYNGGAQAQVASGTDSATLANTSFGTKWKASASATGYAILPSGQLDTGTIDVANSLATTDTFTVWITQTGLTQPTGPVDFFSAFTTNILHSGWTVQESTYVSLADAKFGGTLLSSHTFAGTGLQTASGTAPFNISGTPFSITARYVISPNNVKGSANSTINIVTPEPASMMLLGAGLLGLGIFRRRK